MGNQSQSKNKKEYISPLKDELDLAIQNVGEGVILHFDEENKRVLLDIDVSKRRGISSSGTTVKIATATYQIPNRSKSKLTLNVWDKDMTDNEMVDVDKLLDKKLKEKALKKKRDALRD